MIDYLWISSIWIIIAITIIYKFFNLKIFIKVSFIILLCIIFVIELYFYCYEIKMSYSADTSLIYEIVTMSNLVFVITLIHTCMFKFFPFMALLYICKNIVEIFIKKKYKKDFEDIEKKIQTDIRVGKHMNKFILICLLIYAIVLASIWSQDLLIKFKTEKYIKTNQLLYKEGESMPYTGIAKYWDRRGRIKSEYEYKNGKRDGIGKTYHDNGKISEVSSWSNDIQNGFIKTYDSDGTFYSESYWNNGKRDGVSRTYYKDGKIRSKSFYKNGVLEGVTSDYYEDGALRLESAHENEGKLVFLKTYNKSGQIEEERIFSENVEEYITRSYYENGNLREEKSRKTYKTDGVLKNYYENGVLKTESEYKDGHKHGLERKYDEFGTLISEDEYDDGKLVKKGEEE